MLVLVALAGGVGAVLRFLADGWVTRRVRSSVPLGTMAVNVVGSFCLGVVVASASGDAELVLGTGLLGGFTTFSAASVEAVTLALVGGRRAAMTAAAHATVMLVLGLVAAALGLTLGAALA